MNWSELLKENKILNGIKGFEGKYDCFSNFCTHDTIFIKLPYGKKDAKSVSYTHLTLPTIYPKCRSRWSPYH